MIMTLKLYFPEFLESHGAKMTAMAIRSHLRACPTCLLKNRSRNMKNIHVEPATKLPENQAMLTDCTFKRVQSGYPVLCTRVKPFDQGIRLLSLSIVIREDTESCEYAFKHLRYNLRSFEDFLSPHEVFRGNGR